MRAASGLWRALEQARRDNLAAESAAMPARVASGLSRRALLSALAAGTAATALPRLAPARVRDPGRVAIIGGGIAGLSALHRLRSAGVDAMLYEARRRVGGRMHTVRGPNGTLFERGGQLVNSDHADIAALARDFGVALIDRKQGAHRTIVLEGGRIVGDDELAAALRPLAAQIDADARALDADYARVAPVIDRMSIASYLDRHAALIAQPWLRRLIEATARTEYGVEPNQASALELIFSLPVVRGERVEILGASDESYLLAGGSSALTEAIAARHETRIVRGETLMRLDTGSGGALDCRFVSGLRARFDHVVLAVPAPRLRYIEYGLALPRAWRDFLEAIDTGRNEKEQWAVRGRPWSGAIGTGGEIWQTDAGPVALVWDGSVHAPGNPAPVLTFFQGGAQTSFAQLPANALAGVVQPVLGDLVAKRIAVDRSGWGSDPLSLGSYVNFPPGMLTRFGHLLWIESDDDAERQAASWGRLSFVGEHLSDAFAGYMNGAAQTGRLAAERLVGQRFALAADARAP